MVFGCFHHPEPDLNPAAKGRSDPAERRQAVTGVPFMQQVRRIKFNPQI
jgi:hypothetical protein